VVLNRLGSRKVVKQVFDAIRPIVISALSILLTFLVVQPLAVWLDPSFSLLSNRGIGKIAFIVLIIFQIILFFSFLPKQFLEKFLQTNFYFFKNKNWIKKFFLYFLIFAFLHILILFFVWATGFANFNHDLGHLSFKLILRVFFGFFVVFLLAWTEELIFRGTIYLYFAQSLKPIISLLLTSTIFMFAHNISGTLTLQLGLGLFLLGTLLNLIFIKTEKLYAGMGAHAGLVFVKVFLRRIPLLVFLPEAQLPFWMSKDLRTSPVIHGLFLILIIFFVIQNRKKLFS
jgi:membrane protease YdiL (CAAX protease family)